MSQACLPLLGADPKRRHAPGRIVNLSSVSGRIAYPFMGAYAATKHALEAISDTLRRELVPFGIDVILIEPGTVATPMVEKFVSQLERFEGTPYAAILEKMRESVKEQSDGALAVADVARVVADAVTRPRAATRYPLPGSFVTGWLLPRWLPDRAFDWLLARYYGLQAVGKEL